MPHSHAQFAYVIIVAHGVYFQACANVLFHVFNKTKCMVCILRYTYQTLEGFLIFTLMIITFVLTVQQMYAICNSVHMAQLLNLHMCANMQMYFCVTSGRDTGIF